MIGDMFSSVDQHFSAMLCRKNQIKDPTVGHLFAALSQSIGQQNSCLLVSEEEPLQRLASLSCVSEIDLNSAADSGPIDTPLVLLREAKDRAYLYTQRFFAYESRVVTALTLRNQQITDPEANLIALNHFLQAGDDPLQVRAASQAVTRKLALITGGPGTGKTSTVVKILAALLHQTPELRVSLAAPTGKAAMRLSESIQSACQNLGIKVPSDVATLHRLLGMRGDGQSFGYHKNNQLPLDVLILDEASMVDLIMFDRLLAALKDDTQLILLGDPFQLPSVEAGSVLSDITAQGDCYSKQYVSWLKERTDITIPSEQIAPHPLANAHCALKTSFRFRDDSGIGEIAKVLRNNTSEPQALTTGDEVQIVSEFSQTTVVRAMQNLYEQYLSACHEPNTTAEALLDLFETAQLLTPLREGEFGVQQLNEVFETEVHPDTDSYYHGKPLMIERNHYALRLFNGDIGICVRRGDRIEVAFRKPNGDLEYYLPSRLPQHETCYAMTVHKSQGSEFNRVSLVLPETQQENFISRELVYTGVTRCRQQLTIFTTFDLTETQPDSRISALSLRLKPATVRDQSETQLELF